MRNTDTKRRAGRRLTNGAAAGGGGGDPGAGDWTPASAGVAPSVWFEPAPARCFTDTAGTTQAAVAGSVARQNSVGPATRYGVQETAGIRPTLQLVNGRHVTRHVPIQTFALDAGLVLTNFSLFVVSKTTGDHGYLGSNASAPQTRNGQSGGNVLSMFDGSNNPISGALTKARGVWVAHAFVRDGVLASFFEDGVARGTGAMSADPLTFNRFGSFNANDSNAIAGDVALVVAFPGVLSAGDAVKMHAYAAAIVADLES